MKTETVKQIARLVVSIDQFDAYCDAQEHTDTGALWELVWEAQDILREVLAEHDKGGL